MFSSSSPLLQFSLIDCQIDCVARAWDLAWAPSAPPSLLHFWNHISTSTINTHCSTGLPIIRWKRKILWYEWRAQCQI